MKWRVLPFETRDAYHNMAVDEAVSEAIQAGSVDPTIRFYRWKPSAVSIGYFQSLEEEVDLEECNEDGIDYVRRRTGGGAVYHDYEGEVTYSILGPEDLFPSDIAESYRHICGYVVDALGSLGIESEFEPVNDIEVNGRKISGNAQTRRKGVLLQHGTILHSVDPQEMFTYLRPEIDKVSDKMVENIYERVTSINHHRETDIDETYEALRDAFTADKDTFEGELTQHERDRAEELAYERYSSEDWNFMR
ncbi:MAG: biotin/lipoate A/B protein ligase family protein [Halobacteria archaeon]|nr:biotin/lipoate A/B protein ligase family protein [Halobacteria archaeon]